MTTDPVLAPAPSPPATDGEVVAAVLAGDVDAFAVLVRRHNQALYRACRAVLADDAEAEDAVQAAWISGYRALAQYRADARFRTWMTRIAVHEAAARLRSRRRLAAVDLEAVPMMIAPSDPEHEVMTQELGRRLEAGIDGLAEGMRTVLVLRDVIELDTAETAACLGIGEEAVRVRLHRARQALARTLDATLDDAAAAAPQVWRFDGERCARVLAGVMAALARAKNA